MVKSLCSQIEKKSQISLNFMIFKIKLFILKQKTRLIKIRLVLSFKQGSTYHAPVGNDHLYSAIGSKWAEWAPVGNPVLGGPYIMYIKSL